jgi:hypothetical protein
MVCYYDHGCQSSNVLISPLVAKAILKRLGFKQSIIIDVDGCRKGVIMTLDAWKEYDSSEIDHETKEVILSNDAIVDFLSYCMSVVPLHCSTPTTYMRSVYE